MDTIARGDDIEDQTIRRDIGEMVLRWLFDFRKALNERERFVLDHRIMAEKPLTLREIVRRFKTTKDNIRQLQARISRRVAKVLRTSEIGV